MFFQDKLEEKIKNNKKKALEIDIRLEKLDHDITKFLEELPLSIEQLNIFLANHENFTQEEWEALQHIKQRLDERLQRELDNIRNPNKTKKSLEGLRVQRHWLHVR